jgi:methylase of polypeptide subunit release factors
MKNNQILDITHRLIKSYINEKDIVIDMTMGNGYDTLFLACISKFVYAFDIQDEALRQTQKRLDQHQITNVKLIKDTHENILKYVHHFKYVVYNLGYLPKGDKTITTLKKSTLNSLNTVLEHIDDDGIIFIMVYEGHKEGYEESIALDKHLKNLSTKDYLITKTYLPYQKNNPPYLLIINKKELNKN